MTVRRASVPGAALALTGILALVGLSCGGGGSPSSSTPPTTAAPAPSPTPTPVGGGGIVAASCPIGPGDPEATCSITRSSLYLQVEAAIDLLIREKPEIFNLEDIFKGTANSYMVRDLRAYVDGLVANLQAAGLCAQRDLDDALQQSILVKSANNWSEDFDLLMESGHMLRARQMYRQTCVPASFPLDRPADAPPLGSGCYRPYPPTVSRFNCKVHLKGKEFYTLDSTPLVGPNPEYCASIGFPDRSICPVRPEGSVDRVACENWRVGKAKDTGRPGPTWTREGSFCTGPASGCANTPDGQYSLWAYQGGTYKVAAENGAFCELIVYR